jgi:hypothetical protein
LQFHNSVRRSGFEQAMDCAKWMIRGSTVRTTTSWWALPVNLCAPEERNWTKAYIMERERFDGADIAHMSEREIAGWTDAIERIVIPTAAVLRWAVAALTATELQMPR